MQKGVLNEVILQARETHNVNPAEVLRILSYIDDLTL